jgi:hypothetical protein
MLRHHRLQIRNDGQTDTVTTELRIPEYHESGWHPTSLIVHHVDNGDVTGERFILFGGQSVQVFVGEESDCYATVNVGGCIVGLHRVGSMIRLPAKRWSLK